MPDYLMSEGERAATADREALLRARLALGGWHPVTREQAGRLNAEPAYEVQRKKFMCGWEPLPLVYAHHPRTQYRVRSRVEWRGPPRVPAETAAPLRNDDSPLAPDLALAAELDHRVRALERELHHLSRTVEDLLREVRGALL